MGRKILLLGATGNVGQPLVRLFKNSKRSFALGVYPPDQQKIVGVANQIPVDFDEISTLKAALDGMDTVFIIIPDSHRMVIHMRNVSAALKESSVNQFVYVGGLGVKVASNTWLSKMLLKCEETLIDSGLNGIILRPCFFMQNFINHYPPDDNHTFSMPMEQGEINYIDVRDVAYAAFVCLTQRSLQPNHIEYYHLTGNKALNTFEIARVFSRTLGKTYRYANVSLSEELEAMSKSGAPDWRIKMLSGIYTHVQKNAYAISCNDFTKITGRLPIDFELFIRANKNFFENA